MPGADPSWLIDKSALARLASSPDAELWVRRIERGLVQITTATLLEIGYSARSAADWVELVDEPPVSRMPIALLTPAAERRAVQVQRQLAGSGRHRAPSIPDLLIAATAELGNLVALHINKDFYIIAVITGQSLERLAIR